jgi:hypothetical protein
MEFRGKRRLACPSFAHDRKRPAPIPNGIGVQWQDPPLMQNCTHCRTEEIQPHILGRRIG